MIKESPGEMLRNARESKKITLDKAAEATNITIRHLRALEQNNFGVFPGETYILGFITNYANYLNIESQRVVQAYKEILMAETEVPLQQLTEPTMNFMDNLQKYFKPILILLAAAIVLFFLIKIISGGFGGSENDQNRTENSTLGEILVDSEKIPKTATRNIKLKDGYAIEVLGVSEGVDFSLRNGNLQTEVYLILKGLKYKQGPNGLSMAVVEVYPGKKLFNLTENQATTVSEKSIARSFQLVLMGATPNNVKIRVELSGNETENPGEKNANQIHGEDNEEVVSNNQDIKNNQITRPDNFIISFQGEVTRNNFIEIYVDGQLRKKGIVGANSILQFEANNSIQLRVGDGGGIRVTVNGKAYNWGQPGIQYTKVIRKIKDPIEQTKFNIVVKDQ